MNRILLALLINFWKLLLLFPRPMHKGLAYILGNLLYLMPIKRNKISKKNIDLCNLFLSISDNVGKHKSIFFLLILFLLIGIKYIKLPKI